MLNISAFGIRVRLFASFTFPSGIDITQFADDADPADMASIQIRDKGMGINGDLLVWSKGVPIPLTLNVIPGGGDDNNLAILARTNRAGKGRRAVLDVVTVIVIYPDGTSTQFLRGAITDAIIGKPAASSGRLKSKPYIFTFEDVQ